MSDHELIAALPDVARLTVHEGQVLFYPRHTPPGIFIVVEGAVRRFADGKLPEAGCGERIDAAAGAFAVPAPGELSEPAKAGVVAASDAEILFVPRSVALQGTAVAQALAVAGIEVWSLAETATRRRAR